MGGCLTHSDAASPSAWQYFSQVEYFQACGDQYQAHDLHRLAKIPINIVNYYLNFRVQTQIIKPYQKVELLVKA